MEYIYNATLKRVVDGDTLYLDVDLGFGLTMTRKFRLISKTYSNFDTSEIYRPTTETERTHGYKAKEYLEQLLTDQEFIITSVRMGKYRYVCMIQLNGKDIGDLMIENDFNKITPIER